MAGFKQKWLIAVEAKNSVLCAGLDPSSEALHKKGISKRDFALSYIEAVAPYCAAVKFNSHFWKEADDIKTLDEIIRLSHLKDMVIIEDCKLGDIGSSNEEAMNYARKRNTDAITFSPFAGNLQEAGDMAKKKELGIISLCLMSNPEYEKQKNNFMKISKLEVAFYSGDDLLYIKEIPYARYYIALACKARIHNIDGIVVGAPSDSNHISEQEIKNISKYVRHNQVVLVPGMGTQGGNPKCFWDYFNKSDVIVNVGRTLMYPRNILSTPEDQKEAAKNICFVLNEMRTKK